MPTSTLNNTEARLEVDETAQKHLPEHNIVDWDGPDDPTKPLNWSPFKKNFHVVLISLYTLFGNLASTMFAPGAAQLAEEFGITSNVVAAFTVSIYLLGFGVGPLIISPLSEVYGRLLPVHISVIVFMAFTIGCAVSTNTTMFFIFRFIAGSGCSAPMTIGGGVIADMTVPEKRGKAMGIWAVGPLMGPIIGPIIGGFISQRLSWRWTFWILAMMTAPAFILGILFMRESNATILLSTKAKRLRRETGNSHLMAKGDSGRSPRQVLLKAIIRPTRLLLFSPIVSLLSLYAAFVTGLIILLFTTFPAVYEGQYNFSVEISGLAYLGLGIGCAVAMISFGKLSDSLREKLKGSGEATPEMRLPLMMWTSPMIGIGFIWYGWSSQAHTHWIVPIIGTIFIGAGSLFVIIPTQIYLIDAFGPEAAASALAANVVLRTMAGAFITLAGPPLYDRLGLGWGNTLLGLICLAFVPVPFLFYRYGKSLREKFVFVP